MDQQALKNNDIKNLLFTVALCIALASTTFGMLMGFITGVTWTERRLPEITEVSP